MCTRSSPFSSEDLLTRIREAESLRTQLMELLQCDDKFVRNAFALRWAVVADEVTRLIALAEEQLPEEQTLQIQQIVNNNYPECWESYRERSGRLEQLYDKSDPFIEAGL